MLIPDPVFLDPRITHITGIHQENKEHISANYFKYNHFLSITLNILGDAHSGLLLRRCRGLQATCSMVRKKPIIRLGIMHSLCG